MKTGNIFNKLYIKNVKELRKSFKYLSFKIQGKSSWKLEILCFNNFQNFDTFVPKFYNLNVTKYF